MLLHVSITLLLLGTATAGDVMLPCDDVSCPELWCDNPYYVEGECCQLCPPGCMLNDTVWHPVGAIYCDDPCDFCECYDNGTSICGKIYCPELKCEKTINEDDWCCEECQDGGCLYKDALYGPGPMDTGDACEDCTCDEFGDYTCNPKPCETTSECENVACPELPCSEDMALQGECCLYCPPGCVMYDIWYAYGPMKFEEETCEECICLEDGSYDCIMKECPDPADLPCPSEAQFEGECCTECPVGCTVDDSWYGAGVVPSRDPCQTCTCGDDGTYACVDNPCPELDCPGDLHVQGECCNSCPPGCEYMGGWYGTGLMDDAQQCATCTCETDGNVQCVPEPCDPPPCPAEVQFTPEGECCPQCPAGCEVNANWYGASVAVPSEDPCETCTCRDDGELDCQRNPCEQPECSHGYLAAYSEEGACCPECLRSCRYRGALYAFNAEVVTRRRCRVCKCGANGRVRCARVACPPLTCLDGYYPYTEYLECCPTCRPMLK